MVNTTICSLFMFQWHIMTLSILNLISFWVKSFLITLYATFYLLGFTVVLSNLILWDSHTVHMDEMICIGQQIINFATTAGQQ